MSFCILTLIMSAGVPINPPAAPASEARATLWINGMASPDGATNCFEAC